MPGLAAVVINTLDEGFWYDNQQQNGSFSI